MQTYSNSNTEDIRTDAANLRDWLSLPGAESRYSGANVMAAWLTILLESCTPEEADEQLVKEVDAIISLVRG